MPVAGSRVSPGRLVVRLEQVRYAAYSMYMIVMQGLWFVHNSRRLCPLSFKLPVPKIPMQLGQESRSEPTPSFKLPSRYSCPMARLLRWWCHVPCGPALRMSVNAQEVRWAQGGWWTEAPVTHFQPFSRSGSAWPRV